MVRRKRKSLLPAVLLSVLFWLVFGFFLFLVNPEIIKDLPLNGSYFPFFASLFFAVFLTASLVFAHTRRGFLVSLGVTSFLYLRLFGLGHVLNAILLFSFLLILELSFSSKG